MEKTTQFRTGRHCVFKLYAHLVFITKYRRGVFDDESIFILREVLQKVCEDLETELLDMNGEDDHIHLLVSYPPKLAISVLVNSLKGVSSRRLRQRQKRIVDRYWKNVLWSPSYCAVSCGGAPLETIKAYIQKQRL